MIGKLTVTGTPRVRDSKYFMKQMLLAKQDEAGVILIDEQNNFLFADASRMEEIEELSAITNVQFDDQIIDDIIFDSPNGNVNSGNIKKETHVPDLYTEDTLDDASKSQQKVYKKMNDPIAVANKQDCWTIDYAQINALYKDFVPQKELSAEQKYFPSSFIPSDKNSNATPSISASMPKMDKLIAHVSEKTYAYGAIRAENQNLLFTISELKSRLANAEKVSLNDASSVRRPMNKDSHVKNSVLANSKKPAKKVAVYVRKNKQTDITSENVITNKENVIDVDDANASKAKTFVMCFLYAKYLHLIQLIQQHKINLMNVCDLEEEKRERSLDNNSYVEEYDCYSLALD
ncbi:hypothetical protein Tco_1402872 [Tanacetum coccineum]